MSMMKRELERQVMATANSLHDYRREEAWKLMRAKYPELDAGTGMQFAPGSALRFFHDVWEEAGKAHWCQKCYDLGLTHGNGRRDNMTTEQDRQAFQAGASKHRADKCGAIKDCWTCRFARRWTGIECPYPAANCNDDNGWKQWMELPYNIPTASKEQAGQPASAEQELREGLAKKLQGIYWTTMVVRCKPIDECWQAVADYVRQLVKKGRKV